MLFFASPFGASREIVVREASGIARRGDCLIIVGDDQDGVYFELPLGTFKGPVIPIDPAHVREVRMPGAELAMDLESIDVLADGRIVVLSEQLRSLIGKGSPGGDRYGIIAEYGKVFTEFGNRGLEGLAVAKKDGGNSRVAVLWEGGYPEYEDVPQQLREVVSRMPLAPVIVVHDVAAGDVAGTVRAPLSTIVLQMPAPPGAPTSRRRFRGTDLVWHRWQDREVGGRLVEGFIVLMSSEEPPPDASDEVVRYELKLLQRFGFDGRPRGEPLSINELCRAALEALDRRQGQAPDQGPEQALDTAAFEGMSGKSSAHLREIADLLARGSWENINWEGLGWYEEGESLVAIYDGVPLDPPFAFVFDIPPDWK